MRMDHYNHSKQNGNFAHSFCLVLKNWPWCSYLSVQIIVPDWDHFWSGIFIFFSCYECKKFPSRRGLHTRECALGRFLQLVPCGFGYVSGPNDHENCLLVTLHKDMFISTQHQLQNTAVQKSLWTHLHLLTTLSFPPKKLLLVTGYSYMLDVHPSN